MKFLAAQWRHRGAELFGIDLRSLALFRVGLASMLIYYVLNRVPDIGAFYTDWGILPRGFLVQFDGWSRLSLYFVNGGRIKISKVTRDGKSLTLFYCGPSELFGESCLVDGGPPDPLQGSHQNGAP